MKESSCMNNSNHLVVLSVLKMGLKQHVFCIKLKVPSDNANDLVWLPTRGSFKRAVVQEPVHSLPRGTTAYIHVFTPAYPQCCCYYLSPSLEYFAFLQERMVLCTHTLLGTSSLEDFSLFTDKPIGAHHMNHSPAMCKYGLIEH